MTETAKESAQSKRWIRTLDAGKTLFEEGDTDRRLYVLIDGRVEILKDGDRIAEIGVADSFIGEVGALMNSPRWATAKTLTKCTMLVVGDVEELFRLEPAWGLKLSRVLATRLQRTNERFGRLKQLLEVSRNAFADDDAAQTLEEEVNGAHEDGKSLF